MALTYALIAAFVVMIVSLVGAITSISALNRWFKNKMHYLVSFSAGVFLVVSLNIVREIADSSSYIWALLLALAGLLLFFLIDKMFPESHHHHELESDHTHSKRGGRRILYADSLHNFVDGIVLLSAFAISFKVGIVVSIGVLIHEAIQEISEFFVLKEAGYNTREALVRNFGVSATILVGVLLGALLSSYEIIVLILLGVAGGGFIHVVFVDLIPSQLKKCESKNCKAKHASWALLGALVMVLIGLI